MADSVNRIVPSTVASERYPILRRERDEKNRKESRQKDGAKQKTFPVSSATDTTPTDNHDETTDSGKDRTKGKILDINA